MDVAGICLFQNTTVGFYSLSHLEILLNRTRILSEEDKGEVRGTHSELDRWKECSDVEVVRSFIFSKGIPALYSSRYQIHQHSSSLVEDELDPFSLVADELSHIGNKLREMVVAEVPKLASAAEYFFKMGVEGKRFRPTHAFLLSSIPHFVVLISSDSPTDARVSFVVNVNSIKSTNSQSTSSNGTWRYYII
ncbi:geranylgeranyl pyrophosphate synthase [Trifolium pratense]|uniref:Geranylgeranyl pyrophosphate synthase n=1 Tax=Trifolium pratense TaxID=57577 RepID=A0A2K3MS87_TRIPR|nr:geranylgeranyl pyrophosphate synthase [Trifolium pratense]